MFVADSHIMPSAPSAMHNGFSYCHEHSLLLLQCILSAAVETLTKINISTI
jgi:hypothetical protein